MQKPLLLNDLLHLSEKDLNRTKVKLSIHGGGKPQIEVFLENPDGVNDNALFWRTKQRYFYVGEIAIGLVQMSQNTWLLTTIKEVTKDLDIEYGINYEGSEIEAYRAFFGRVVIKYHKTTQRAVRLANSIISNLEVQQILPSVFDGVEFPGYDKVRLSYEQLSAIIQRQRRDWVAALENQKAVYLITDTASGKQYVGSAYGDNGMLLNRWINYEKNGHGGNKLLKAIVKEFGFDYVKQNFQYSILENYNARVNKQIILERESWWKETLGSRAFGLNAN